MSMQKLFTNLNDMSQLGNIELETDGLQFPFRPQDAPAKEAVSQRVERGQPLAQNEKQKYLEQIDVLISAYDQLIAIFEEQIDVDSEVHELRQEIVLIQKRAPQKVHDTPNYSDIRQKLEEALERKAFFENEKANLEKSQGEYVEIGDSLRPCADLMVRRTSEASYLPLKIQSESRNLENMQFNQLSLNAHLQIISSLCVIGNNPVHSTRLNGEEFVLDFFTHQDTTEDQYDQIFKFREVPVEAEERDGFRVQRYRLRMFLKANPDSFHILDGELCVTDELAKEIQRDQDLKEDFLIASDFESHEKYLIIRSEGDQGRGVMFRARVVKAGEMQGYKEEIPEPRKEVMPPAPRRRVEAQSTDEVESGRIVTVEHELRSGEETVEVAEEVAREIAREVSEKPSSAKKAPQSIREVHIERLTKMCAVLKYDAENMRFRIPRRFASALDNLPGYRVGFASNGASLRVVRATTRNEEQRKLELRPFFVEFEDDAPVGNTQFLPALRPTQEGWGTRIYKKVESFGNQVIGLWRAFASLFKGRSRR